jgi:hypothetical protein
MSKSSDYNLDIGLPPNFDNYTPIVKASVIEYLKHLDTRQQRAYLIAKDHLGSSFNILKSNGYIDWLNEAK